MGATEVAKARLARPQPQIKFASVRWLNFQRFSSEVLRGSRAKGEANHRTLEWQTHLA